MPINHSLLGSSLLASPQEARQLAGRVGRDRLLPSLGPALPRVTFLHRGPGSRALDHARGERGRGRIPWSITEGTRFCRAHQRGQRWAQRECEVEREEMSRKRPLSQDS